MRSDGAANQAVEAVLHHEELIGDLIEGLSHTSDVLRGRTADALEKIARSRPDLVVNFHTFFIELLEKECVAMVKMHLAMALGHLACYEYTIPSSVTVLIKLLGDKTAFVKSWAISSLCIIARLYPSRTGEITQRISELKNDESIAIRTRVFKAMETLINQKALFPKGWNKSEHINL